jgi:hypothetical protein
VEPADNVEEAEDVDALKAVSVVERRVDADASPDDVAEEPEADVIAEAVVESGIEVEIDVGSEVELGMEVEIEVVEAPDVVAADIGAAAAAAAVVVVVVALSTSDDTDEVSDTILCVADECVVSDIEEEVAEDFKGT